MAAPVGDVFAARRQAFADDARKRRMHFGLFEIVLRRTHAHLDLPQLRGELDDLRTRFVELVRGDTVGRREFFQALARDVRRARVGP